MATPAAQLVAIEPADRLELTADGRIVNFLDPTMTRANLPEERVRQTYARRLHFEYRYPKERMRFGSPIHIGREPREADIVVYVDEVAARTRDQGRIHLIVETKAPNEKKGVGQLKSYILASSAGGGVWINESDPPKYFRRVEGKIETWPNIPRADETWDEIGQHTKVALRAPHDLVETFRRCHNALYKVGIDSEDLAMDMVRIILAKYQDETIEGDTPEFHVTPLELRYAEGRKRVAARIRDLFEEVRDNHLEVFDKHETITAGDSEIATIVAELQDFRFLSQGETDEVYDVVGAAYEVYIGSHLKGDRGQYFTHRLIVSLLVRLVDPGDKDVILDPAMGSGGFLISAMRHIGQKIERGNRSKAAKQKALRDIHNHLLGIDKSLKLVKVAKTNMILASDGHSGLVHGDSLKLDSIPPTIRDRQPSVILTNPPFGATAEHRITPDREPELLAHYDIAHAWRKGGAGPLMPTKELISEGVPPEYLFVERCIRWVRPGGKVGIVLPRGILDNDKTVALRTLIMQECRVLAVVNCHDDTFKPHTDAKAALLVLQRKPQPSALDEDYPIFMAISQGIGHNGVGETIYRTDAKGDRIMENGQPILDEDTNEIFAAREALRRGEPSGTSTTSWRSTRRSPRV